MEFSKQKLSDDRAVSPVVGVILMVAITVILAAVIGTFVLDLGSDQTEPPRAGVQFEKVNGGSDLRLTLIDAGNVDSLDTKTGSGSATEWTTDPSAGDTTTLTDAASKDVVVIGTNNGEDAIVSQYSA